MTPSARVAATSEILDEVATANAPADAILANWFRTHRLAGSKDKRAIRELVYRDLRKGALLRWMSVTLDADPQSARVRTIIASEQEGAGTAVSRFDGKGYGPEVLSEAGISLVERLHSADKAPMPDWVRAECPEDFPPRKHHKIARYCKRNPCNGCGVPFVDFKDGRHKQCNNGE